MGPEVTIFVTMVIACQIAMYTDARPQKVYAEGYSGRNLPRGRWTRWFDSSLPGMVGEYETVENVVREYGRGCGGMLCRRPLAVKAISVFGLTPSEHRDRVHLHARTGLICRHNEQEDRRCMDYKVRFYCPNSQITCENHRSHHKEPQVNEMSETETGDKLSKLFAKENMVKQPNEAVNYFKVDDKILVEMPEYVKYPLPSPKVILPHIRGKLAQMPDYKDAMTSHNKNGEAPQEFEIMLQYLRDDAPSDSATSEFNGRRALMKDSAPSVNGRGRSFAINHVQPQGENSIMYRHFRKQLRNPRAPFG